MKQALLRGLTRTFLEHARAEPYYRECLRNTLRDRAKTIPDNQAQSKHYPVGALEQLFVNAIEN